jgi:hypothetical protein
MSSTFLNFLTGGRYRRAQSPKTRKGDYFSPRNEAFAECIARAKTQQLQRPGAESAFSRFEIPPNWISGAGERYVPCLATEFDATLEDFASQRDTSHPDMHPIQTENSNE